jgi:glutaredoxin
MNFKVYTKENCPHYYKIKQVLDLTGTQFVSYIFEEDFTREEFYAKFGRGSTFPQVVCDNKKIRRMC